LALYGVLRWGTLLTPAPIWRLLGLLALALLVAGPGRALGARSRALTILGAVVAVAAMFALAGLPLAWVRHVRIAVSADAIGQGLSSLPGVLVPYTGINEWVRMVTVLGAGVLLLDAALMLAFAPRTLGEMRRASAALPLVALAVVPSTLVHPHLPYLHGLILFALLAAFIWGERVSRYDLPLAVGVEDELALPPFVKPLVVELPLALDPPELSLVDEPEDDPDALALALLPLVVPVVEVVALEPEPVMAAMPFEMASASALDIPTIAWPFSV